MFPHGPSFVPKLAQADGPGKACSGSMNGTFARRPVVSQRSRAPRPRAIRLGSASTVIRWPSAARASTSGRRKFQMFQATFTVIRMCMVAPWYVQNVSRLSILLQCERKTATVRKPTTPLRHPRSVEGDRSRVAARLRRDCRKAWIGCRGDGPAGHRIAVEL